MIRNMIFPDEALPKPHSYAYYKSGTPYNPDPGAENWQHIESEQSVLGLNDFLALSDGVIIDIGAGPGEAARFLASELRKRKSKAKVLAIDKAYGKELYHPQSFFPNLEFKQMDWEHIELPAQSVDAVIAGESIGRYGGTAALDELNRLAKIGTIFRGTQNDSIEGLPNFADKMILTGWDVYRPYSHPNVIIAKKVA